MRALFLAPAMLLAVAAPAFSSTILCEAPGGDPMVEIAIDFNAERNAGEITGVRVQTQYFDMSTYPGESQYETETIAIADVTYDRITVGLDSEQAARIVFYASLVRAAVYDPQGGPDSDVVVAGVANIGSERTATLLCTGW